MLRTCTGVSPAGARMIVYTHARAGVCAYADVHSYIRGIKVWRRSSLRMHCIRMFATDCDRVSE